MAASQSPMQGSLFAEDEKSATERTEKNKLSQITNEELSTQQLKDDAKIRPRSKKNNKSQNTTNSLDEFYVQEPEYPKWSHHSLPNLDHLTPALRHYVELKIEHPDRILLYRLGDFFECFFEDAIKLSELLELTLTSKEGGKKIGRVPMAGIPHHASDRYCTQLIKKGLSIAICDQLEDAPSKGNKLIKRGITRLITPGTILEEGMLMAKQNNWLASVLIDSHPNKEQKIWSLAKVDVSTGELLVQEGEDINTLKQELMKLEAAEVISEKNTINNDNWYNKSINITEFNQTSFSELESKKIFLITTLYTMLMD